MLGVATLQSEIEARTGSRIALSGKTALEIGTDKLKTASWSRRRPSVIEKQELSGEWPDILDFAEEIGYPCVVKGRRAGCPLFCEIKMILLTSTAITPMQSSRNFWVARRKQRSTRWVFYTPEHGVIDSYCMSRLLRYGLTWRGKYEETSGGRRLPSGCGGPETPGVGERAAAIP